MSFANDRRVLQFTQGLWELVAEKKLNLVPSLEIMTFEKRTGVEKACLFIKEELSCGNNFSRILKVCPHIDFDEVYVSFIGFSELTGNISDTLDFLKKRCERKVDCWWKIIQATLYPALVICFAFGLCIFLGCYNSAMTGTAENIFAKKDFLLACGILFTFFVIACFGIKKSLSESRLYESFLGMSFLIGKGGSVANALDAGIAIVGENSKYGRLFHIAKERLEFGMDIYAAFDQFELTPELRQAFYYANMAGNKADVFEKISEQIGKKDAQRKERCLKLLEPFFLGITGIFLVIVLVSYFMPMMMNLSWI